MCLHFCFGISAATKRVEAWKVEWVHRHPAAGRRDQDLYRTSDSYSGSGGCEALLVIGVGGLRVPCSRFGGQTADKLQIDFTPSFCPTLRLSMAPRGWKHGLAKRQEIQLFGCPMLSESGGNPAHQPIAVVGSDGSHGACRSHGHRRTTAPSMPSIPERIASRGTTQPPTCRPGMSF